MKVKSTCLLVLFLCYCIPHVLAQRWSYVYIQGDKQVPFYVKLEGEMLPRYGKNYCIIPQLSAGPIRVQILFQQNAFPPQDYTLLVPDDGFRAFLLTRRDNAYALYDLHQQFYLKPGEKDHLPSENIITKEAAPLPQKPEPSPASKPVVVKKQEKQQTEDIRQSANSNEPDFIANLTLKNNNSEKDTEKIMLAPTKKPDAPLVKQQEIPTEEPVTNSKAEPDSPAVVNLESNQAPIVNSDCPTPMSDEAFENIYRNAREKTREDKLVAYLLKKIDGNCYSTKQVYQLADLLEEEPVVFLYLKRVYSRITDQQNFPLLEPYLFESDEWIRAFRLIH